MKALTYEKAKQMTNADLWCEWTRSHDSTVKYEMLRRIRWDWIDKSGLDSYKWYIEHDDKNVYAGCIGLRLFQQCKLNGANSQTY